MKMPNFKLEMKGDRKAVLEIYDRIGPSWAGMIDAGVVSQAVNEAGPLDHIEVRINSLGGSVFEGLAIHNILKNHPAKKHGRVDGVAASSATLPMVACDTIEVPKNALVMIHDPTTIADGGEKDMLKAAELLSRAKQSIVDTYASRTGKTAEELAGMMSEETWMDGEQAVANGFATTMTKEIAALKPAEAAAPKALAESGFAYSRAPERLSSLLSLAMIATRKENDPMPETKTAEQIAAEAKAAAELAVANEAAAKALADKNAADVKNAAETERNRAAEIMAVCTLAKRPELAADYIANGTDLVAVQAAIIKVMSEANPPKDDGPTDRTTSTTDPHAAYKAEYAQNKAYYQRHGTSEDDYVQSRLIDAEQAARQA